MPVGDILVSDARGDVKHDNRALALNAVNNEMKNGNSKFINEKLSGNKNEYDETY